TQGATNTVQPSGHVDDGLSTLEDVSPRLVGPIVAWTAANRRFPHGIDRYSGPMPTSGSPREESLASERDFYRRLLDLGGKDESEPLVDEALALIVEVTGASTGYLELYDDEANRPRFWKGYRCTDRDVASIRASISHGIIARAIGEGRTIETPSATLDARFSELGSVRQHMIQAVLCAPVGVQP